MDDLLTRIGAVAGVLTFLLVLWQEVRSRQKLPILEIKPLFPSTLIDGRYRDQGLVRNTGGSRCQRGAPLRPMR